MNDEGVSAVVSAVLLFTLFSTAFLFWTLDTLPDWVEDREHNHALRTAAGFAQVGAELDATPIGESASVGIGLAPQRVPLLQTASATGSLEVQSGFGFSAAYTGAEAFMIGGAMVAAPGTELPSLSGVTTLRAVELSYQGPGTNQDGYTQITAYSDADEDGTLDATEASVQARLGKRSGTSATVCGNTEAFLEVRTGSGTNPPVVATHAIACSPGNDATFSVNLMAQEYRFSSLLGRLGGEYSVNVQDVSAGTSRIAMVWTGSDGATRALGTGAATDVDMALDGERVAYRALYQEFEQRTVAFEGGGVINIESLGSAFAQPPVFTVAQDAGEGHLRWRIVDLAGQGSASGADAATIRFTKTAVSEYVVRLDAGDSATFTMDTAAPTAWQQLWADARVLAGLDAADMVVGSSAGTATLTLANIPWTVHLSVIHADVSVT